MPASGQARGAWGWHPLDSRWAQRVVDAAGVRSGDLVLDVGAGLGALTGPLVRAGAEVIAVELHPVRAAKLRERFGAPSTAGRSEAAPTGNRSGSVRVIQVDATDLRLPTRPFRVISSPPYGVSTALLKRLLAPGSRLLSADLVLQRQVVNRWVEGRAPGAARWTRHYDTSIGIRLPRKAFTPPPHVDSAVLRITKR
ncbi:rRNA adenine N(6)-methyltransferase family protein [Kribbella sp. NPDC051770]|uniref:rRNA adenine N(6)-methyltransferase family protein n=1 Tax=Kribbella sp. NPDC051770 TaxID=3155413 RepID=UPI00344A567C